ncbi:MAG: molybdenum cofactor biosynthesis protein MoaE [Actinomycetota bacterium]|nr:molybdenum cofactor biosynthesis protein MoaE [Actinomycetota bacterium]
MADGDAVTARISPDPIDIGEALSGVTANAVGGIAIFVGTVRSTAAERPGSDVVRLEYEAHPTLAEVRMQEIADEARLRWSLERIVAIHRTGVCDLGTVTVVVACGAAHRAEALDACRWCIDTIKDTVPIWKKEVYADGHAWVGAANDAGAKR